VTHAVIVAGENIFERILTGNPHKSHLPSLLGRPPFVFLGSRCAHANSVPSTDSNETREYVSILRRLNARDAELS